MNTHLKSSWLMMGVEILAGIGIYVGLLFILRAKILDEAKGLIRDKLKK